tara:strand:+ start:198 stop:410 length:213 start_codon:yes stop_codon:yes gene_type:complete
MDTEGWNNHEDTFEEALRRELLLARKQIGFLEDDIKELTKSYYQMITIFKKHLEKEGHDEDTIKTITKEV